MAQVLASLPELQLELRTDTQWATAYLGGRPVATVQRARVYSREPAWSAYDTQGVLICTAHNARAMVRMLGRRFVPNAPLPRAV